MKKKGLNNGIAQTYILVYSDCMCTTNLKKCSQKHAQSTYVCLQELPKPYSVSITPNKSILAKLIRVV